MKGKANGQMPWPAGSGAPSSEALPRETKKERPKKDVFLVESENSLREKFGTTVTIKRNKKKGKIEIEFLSAEDLERILHLLEKN